MGATSVPRDWVISHKRSQDSLEDFIKWIDGCLYDYAQQVLASDLCG